MDDSILETIRKMLGPDETETYYDTDLLVHINTAISTLTQLGIGPSEGFMVNDDTETWRDFVGEDPKLSSVRTYVYLKTKLMFDPPLTSSVLESMKEFCKELEWRLNNAAES